MFINKGSVVEIENNLNFVVLDIKTYEGREIALVQGIEDAVLRFAVEKIDEKNKDLSLVFIDDQNLIKAIATEFDRQDGKL